jgi:hypothetical protein
VRRSNRPRPLQYFHDSEYTGVHGAEVALGVVMSDAQTTEDSTTDAEASAQPPAHSEAEPEDDHLATVRVASLPPKPRPPPAKRISFPPPLPSAPPSIAANGEVAAAGLQRGDLRPSPQPRPSWLHSLLASTLPPPGAAHTALATERLNQRRLGATCVAVALILCIAALVVGFSGPPADSSLSQSVLAAVVVARALMGLGMLGVGAVLLRIGERWFTLGLDRRDPLDTSS